MESYLAVKPKLCTPFIKYAMLLARNRNNRTAAAEDAKTFASTTPVVERVLKAAVAAGTTTDATWASTLLDHSAMVAQFLEVLRDQTVVDRLPGLRRMPFNTLALIQTGAATAEWVGEGVPTPGSQGAFSSQRLDPHKVVAMIVVSTEMLRFGDAASVAAVQHDLIRANVERLDWTFLDPGQGGTASRPSSITYGIAPRHSTGSSTAQITSDLEAAGQTLIDAGSSGATWVFVLHPQTALFLSALRGTTGGPVFPDISVRGGSLLGVPALVSAAARPSGSPGERYIVLIDSDRVLLADDGVVTVDTTTEGSVQMDDSPGAGAQPLTSMWGQELACIRSYRHINWKATANAVAIIDNLTY